MPEQKHIVVIGAGIVGLCSAYCLLREGFRVTLVEKGEPGQAASLGNAGSIGLASVPPLGLPGMLGKAPAMFLDPLHPFTVRLSYLRHALPWLRRFAATLSEERVKRIGAARAALLALVPGAYDRILAEIGRQDLIYRSGLIVAYERPDALERNRFEIELKRTHGVAMETLDGDGLRRLEPALSRRVTCGLHYPEVTEIVLPGKLTAAIRDAFLARGGTLIKDAARGFATADGKATAVIGERGEYACAAAVVAAGAWSRTLMERLGAIVPLVAERGYNITIADPGVDMRVPVMAGDRHVMIVPMDGAIRMTTGSEFADPDAPPRHDAALRIFEAAAGTVDGLTVKGDRPWMGPRPAMPDSLPVIGPCPTAANVFCAFGHGHLGMTLGAITGDIVTSLVAGRAPPLDLAPYRVARRFDGSHLASS